MIKKVYIDTSVVGGVFDSEFELWTNIFFDQVSSGEFKVVVSELLFQELEHAPAKVKYYIDKIPENQVLNAIYDDEAKFLAETYVKA